MLGAVNLFIVILNVYLHLIVGARLARIMLIRVTTVHRKSAQLAAIVCRLQVASIL
jgi:hypothetical protein